MLIKDVIQALERQEVTVKTLAERYHSSPRTVSRKIGKLGYKYDNTNKTYTFTGDPVTVEGVDFATLFIPGNAVPGTAIPGKAVPGTVTPDHPPVKVKKASKPSTVTPTGIAPTPDSIDRLLQASEKPARIYRGYYFDPDILAVIDRASNKSALINEALRRVFNEKGLL